MALSSPRKPVPGLSYQLDFLRRIPWELGFSCFRPPSASGDSLSGFRLGPHCRSKYSAVWDDVAPPFTDPHPFEFSFYKDFCSFTTFQESLNNGRLNHPFLRTFLHNFLMAAVPCSNTESSLLPLRGFALSLVLALGQLLGYRPFFSALISSSLGPPWERLPSEVSGRLGSPFAGGGCLISCYSILP